MSILDRLRDSADQEPTTMLPCDADTAFAMLGNERRRHVVEHVHAHDPIPLKELTVCVAFIETGVEHPDELDEADRRSVYVSLYQTHLPRLEEAGLIEIDEADTVRAAADLGPLVDWMRRVERLCRGDGDRA